jgi:hypothetical protein
MTVQNLETTISKTNAGQLIKNYEALVEEISIGSYRSPYPTVTRFEAANRIMSDLVILYGVKWLLDNSVFPFENYIVEYGNEDKNGFDIRAAGNGEKDLRW